MKETALPPRVMIVDDAPQNLSFLEAVLRNQGYQVLALPCGEMALKAAASALPEIILLDVLMPGLDGYAVCQRLKADPELRGIPVIFLSALDEPLDKVRAFEAGAVDYVVKPFEIPEIEARVRTHLEASRQRIALQETVARLQESERLRENLVQMLVHDLRSPLTVIGLSLDMLQGTLPKSASPIAQMVEEAHKCFESISGMIALLLDLSRLEAGQFPIHASFNDLGQIARSIVKSMGALAGPRRVTVVESERTIGHFDPDLMGRVFGNLLVNAFKFTPETAEIHVVLARETTRVRVSIRDNGPGIPSEYHARIFEKFSQVQPRGNKWGAGLGLAFCKLAVEAHEGHIGLESQVGLGSTFWFTLPLGSPDTSSPHRKLSETGAIRATNPKNVNGSTTSMGNSG